MRQLAISTLALALGAAAALGLVSCGGGEDAKLLPGNTAAEITENLDRVKQYAEEGECVGAEDAVSEVNAQVEGLTGVDPKLVEALQRGAARLSEVIASCDEEETEAVAPSSEATTTEETEEDAAGPGKEGRKGTGEGRKGARKGRREGGKERTAASRENDARRNADHDHARRRPKAAAPALRAASARAPRRRRTGERMVASGILSGRYEIGDRLGSGGMSSVHQATDLILERTVAVKILAEHLSDDERFVARFRREALAVAKLIHPNIVQVYDTGIDDGRHYIVMEYVQGRSGAQILQRHGPLDAETTAEIGAQACAGLDYAHRRGIIHRDVKPGNLMVVGGPVGGGEMTIKLTDFGIARAVEQTRITQVGSVVGTAAYLSPEQVRGEEATPATDVYALGVVLYQFLTGRLPYEGSTLAELAVRQQNERPLPPSTYNDEVPETLGARGAAGPGGRPQPPLRQRRRARRRPARSGMQGEDVTLPLEEGTAATNVLGRRDRRPAASTRPRRPSTARRSPRRPGARWPARRSSRRPPPPVRPAGAGASASAAPSRASPASSWPWSLLS